MVDAFYVGAYWGPRSESVGGCAQQLALCLSRLGEAHPALATWFRQGMSRAEASSGGPVGTSAEALESMLKAGRNRRDTDGQVISELGFSLSLWNNNPAEASFSVTCCIAPAVDFMKNCFVLSLPKPVGVAAELYDPEIVRSVFCSVVDIWDPQWATFTNPSMREAQYKDHGHPIGGWMTYVSGVRKAKVDEVTGLSAEEFSNGTLLVAGANPLQMSDSHLSSVVDFLSRL